MRIGRRGEREEAEEKKKENGRRRERIRIGRRIGGGRSGWTRQE
jgi:hypothetical protein